MPALYTVRNPWQKIRAAVSTADTVMHPTGAGGAPKTNWDARDGTKGVAITAAANGVVVGVIGNTDGKQVTINYWLYAEYGPAEWVASIQWTLGSREVVIDPTDNSDSTYVYADTAEFVDQEWDDDKIRLYDADGNEGLSVCKFDSEGNYFIKSEIAAIDADTTIIPIVRGW